MTDKPHCGWERDSDPDFDFWHTGCEQMFQFTDGGPKENDFDFCPYCGGKLVVIDQPPESV